MTDDEIAALEWVAEQLWAFDDEDAARVATIRAIIERERAGGERAKVVAYLEGIAARSHTAPWEALYYKEAADAIASGAHLGSEGEG